MFKLSTRSSYGLRACLALASTFSAEPVAVVELSKEHSIPRRYLEQILNALRHRGLVVSTRGARGGYRLARNPSSVTIGDVVRAVCAPGGVDLGGANQAQHPATGLAHRGKVDVALG